MPGAGHIVAARLRFFYREPLSSNDFLQFKAPLVYYTRGGRRCCPFGSRRDPIH
jgi:hypothetical protein